MKLEKKHPQTTDAKPSAKPCSHELCRGAKEEDNCQLKDSGASHRQLEGGE